MEKRDYRRVPKPAREVEDDAVGLVIASVKANTRLNVREQPSTEARVLKVLEPGTKVAALRTDLEVMSEKFFKVFDADTKQLIGYCMREFFDISNGGAKT